LAGIAEPPLDAEFDNVRAALTWLALSGNVPGLARLAGAVWYNWVLYGPRKEGAYWIERARAINPHSTFDKTSRLWVMQGTCEFAIDQGRVDQAIAAANECRVLARELNDLVAEATAVANLGYLALEAGDCDRAAAFIREAIQLNERAGHWRAVATDRMLLAIVTYGRGELEEAEEMCRSSLEIHRQTNDLHDVGWELRWLGLIQSERGAIQAAAASLREGLRIWQSVHSLEDLAEWLANVSTLAATCGESEFGARLMAASSALSNRLEYRFLYPERMAHQRAEQALRQALDSEEFEHAWKTGEALPLDRAIIEASEFLDQLLAPAAPPDRAPTLYGLTVRELDVLRLLTQGKSDREIAETLFIGTRTVETHVSNLLGKLGVHNRAEATARAIREGLV
jgi:ATP/maltotriose-dependent transcriptional regulator MalT